MKFSDHLPSNEYCDKSLQAIQIDNARKGDVSLSNHDLERRYLAAISRIWGGAPVAHTEKRQTPIYPREPAISKERSIQEAAEALAALWKINKG